jgi:hypothetical protein
MPLKVDIKNAFQNLTSTRRTRYVNAIASETGYRENIEDVANPGQMIPNPQTKTDFAADKVCEWIKNVVLNAETKAALAIALPTPIDTND